MDAIATSFDTLRELAGELPHLATIPHRYVVRETPAGRRLFKREPFAWNTYFSHLRIPGMNDA
jgi:hypothetical protein